MWENRLSARECTLDAKRLFTKWIPAWPCFASSQICHQISYGNAPTIICESFSLKCNFYYWCTEIRKIIFGDITMPYLRKRMYIDLLIECYCMSWHTLIWKCLFVARLGETSIKSGSFGWCRHQSGLLPPPSPQLWSNYHFFVGFLFLT